MARITMLGTGLIGAFYTQTLHGLRSRDRVVNVYSRSAGRAKAFAAEWGITRWSADLREAVREWWAVDRDGEHLHEPSDVLRAIVEELGITRDDLESVNIMGATVYKHPPDKIYAALATLLLAAGVRRPE